MRLSCEGSSDRDTDRATDRDTDTERKRLSLSGPRRGFLRRPGSLAFVSRVLAPVSSSRALVLVSVLPALAVLALLRICHGRPWRLATLALQGLGPGAPCLTASVSLFVSAVSPSLVPFAVRFLAPCLAAMTCAGVQPSSPRLPSSRTPLRSASPGSWAALAPPLARTQPPQPPQRPRLRPPRPFGTCPATRLQRLCCAQQPPRQPPPGPAPGLALLCRCRSVLRGAAPALSLSRADPLPSSRDWSRAWPSRAAHPLSCASPVSLALLLQLRALRGHLAKLLRLLHQRKPLRLPASHMSRPTLTAIGMPSSTHTASPRLPMSLQPPSPSRPTPLELVGALATSAAVACAKPPSAPCGAKFKRPCRVSHTTRPALVKSLLCTPP